MNREQPESFNLLVRVLGFLIGLVCELLYFQFGYAQDQVGYEGPILPLVPGVQHVQ